MLLNTTVLSSPNPDLLYQNSLTLLLIALG